MYLPISYWKKKKDCWLNCWWVTHPGFTSVRSLGHTLRYSNILQAEHVMEAIQSCKISERQVCVKWWKLGRWFYGFRLRDESHCRRVSLRDVAKEDEVLWVLHRGAIHEVLRVQISIPSPTTTSWSCQSSQTWGLGMVPLHNMMQCLNLYKTLTLYMYMPVYALSVKLINPVVEQYWIWIVSNV